MKVLLSLLVLMQFAVVATSAATPGQIVADDDITAHPPEVLNEELKVFESVGEGIQVIMAVCQDQPDCTFAISESEIDKLIETLDRRISQLAHAREGTVEPGYIELLDEYRDTREQYAMYRREIQDITRAIEEGTFHAEESLSGFEPEPYEEDELPALWEPQYRHEGLTLDMFEDVDEPLPFD
jgi:hypothetical protein